MQLRHRSAATLAAGWPYWVGGVLLALVNTAILALQGKPWGVTSGLLHAGARALQQLGFQPEAWTYFRLGGHGQALGEFGWWDGLLWLNFGVVAGAVLSSLLAAEFRLRRPKKAVLALGGGLLMGYGARLALGCSVGALLGGIASFSLHGWLFAGFVLLGVLAGIRLFRNRL